MARLARCLQMRLAPAQTIAAADLNLDRVAAAVAYARNPLGNNVYIPIAAMPWGHLGAGESSSPSVARTTPKWYPCLRVVLARMHFRPPQSAARHFTVTLSMITDSSDVQ
jgi:hypothetical protein